MMGYEIRDFKLKAMREALRGPGILRSKMGTFFADDEDRSCWRFGVSEITVCHR